MHYIEFYMFSNFVQVSEIKKKHMPHENLIFTVDENEN